MNNGWIKIHRKLLEWEWYDEPNTFRLFIHLLLKANHKPKNYRGVNIGAGQIMTGLTLLSQQTGLSIQKIRTSLNNLKSTNEITSKTNNKGTVIQIVKYKDYQVVTNEQQTNNKQTTTNKNDNNIKNTLYSQIDFLNDWKKARLHYDKQITNITSLKAFELINFNKILKDYGSDDFYKAINGLFFQDTYKQTRLRPTHFLENFETYLTCWQTKEKLFEVKKKETKL